MPNHYAYDFPRGDVRDGRPEKAQRESRDSREGENERTGPGRSKENWRAKSLGSLSRLFPGWVYVHVRVCVRVFEHVDTRV